MFNPLPKIKKPLVSVIVPTYNRGYCLKRTVQSVIDQTFDDWELILVDNHSTDNTDDVITNYTDLRIKHIKIHNEGVVAASRNKGIDTASGEYLAFLDSDDWWTPEKLEKSVQALEKGADVVYHDLYRMLSGTQKPTFRRKVKTRPIKTPVFEDLLFNGNAITNSSVVTRSGIMKKAGGFSEDKQLIAVEDYDTWLRIARLTDKFTRLPYCLGYYTLGEDNLSNTSQSIVNLKRLLALYNDNIQQSRKHIPSWMAYKLANTYYKQDEFTQSKKYAIETIRKPSNIRLKINSISILTSIIYRRVFNAN